METETRQFVIVGGVSAAFFEGLRAREVCGPLRADSLVISGGSFEDSPGTDLPRICAEGLLGTRQHGAPLAEKIIAGLVRQSDRVIILDEACTCSGAKWQRVATTLAHITHAAEAVVVRTDGQRLPYLHWSDCLLPASLATLLAYGDEKRSSLAEDIVAAATSGVDVMQIVYRQASLMRRDPDRAVEALGEYKVFVYVDGFDSHDIVALAPLIDFPSLQQPLAACARQEGICLYWGGDLQDDESQTFFSEDAGWVAVPRTWTRLA